MRKQYHTIYHHCFINIQLVKNEIWRWYVRVDEPDGDYGFSFGSNKLFSRSVLKQAKRRIDQEYPG